MFSIHTQSDIPIYRQLVEQVRRFAASGQLRHGEKLPSVRQVAEQLAINPMTVSKAYSQLEADGVLERRRGVGMVLCESAGTGTDLIRPALNELVRQARQLGLEREALIDQLNAAWQELLVPAEVPQ